MPLRKATTRPNLDFATIQRRRNLKTSSGRNKEGDRVLNKVLKRMGGRVLYHDDGKNFSLDFSFLNLETLPCELFEDEFLYEKCEKYLVGLDVSNNNLKSLDAEIGDFLFLKTLDCSKNRFDLLVILSFVKFFLSRNNASLLVSQI